jgi:hypothetical protein
MRSPSVRILMEIVCKGNGQRSLPTQIKKKGHTRRKTQTKGSMAQMCAA